MREQHQRVIQRLTEHFQQDARFIALIVGGSVMKDRALEDSDVDITLIVTDEEYARREASRDFSYIAWEFSDYPGGYVDGKIFNMAYLYEAAERGSEPTRAAFQRAFVAFSHVAGIEDVLKRIPVYQEHEQQAKIEAFYGQVQLLTWFVPEAEKRNNTYLLARAAADLVLFGGRLILADNKILFPSQKWFMYEVERAAKKPEGFVEMINKLLKHPCEEHAKAFRDSIVSYRDWGLTNDQARVRFLYDVEWAWRTGRPMLQEW